MRRHKTIQAAIAQPPLEAALPPEIVYRALATKPTGALGEEKGVGQAEESESPAPQETPSDRENRAEEAEQPQEPVGAKRGAGEASAPPKRTRVASAPATGMGAVWKPKPARFGISAGKIGKATTHDRRVITSHTSPDTPGHTGYLTFCCYM